MTINKDGNIADIKVIKSLSVICDEEAMRVVKLMPNWIPGKQNGRIVNVTTRVMVKFAINQ